MALDAAAREGPATALATVGALTVVDLWAAYSLLVVRFIGLAWSQ